MYSQCRLHANITILAQSRETTIFVHLQWKTQTQKSVYRFLFILSSSPFCSLLGFHYLDKPKIGSSPVTTVTVSERPYRKSATPQPSCKELRPLSALYFSIPSNQATLPIFFAPFFHPFRLVPLQLPLLSIPSSQVQDMALLPSPVLVHILFKQPQFHQLYNLFSSIAV